MVVVVDGSPKIGAGDVGLCMQEVARKIRIDTILLRLSPGANECALDWARQAKIPAIVCVAEWTTKGKRAPFAANVEMIKRAHALVAVWDGESLVTKHAIEFAIKSNLLLYVWYTKSSKFIQPQL